MDDQESSNSDKQPQDPMRRIIESIPVQIIVFKLASDGTLILSDVNNAANRLMDMTARDLLGRTIDDAFPFLANTGISEILKKITTDDTLWYDDEFTIARNGSNMVFEVNAFQIGQDMVAVSLLDVTKRKEIEKLLEIENERLKEIDKMRKDFLSMTTHELKTPLSSMIGASEFLISYYAQLKDDEILNFIEMIHRGSMRLKTMINDLLAAYRIEESKLILDKKTVDIVDIVGRVIKDTTFLFKHRQQELSYDLPEKCLANVDPFRIEQVITNLLQNACKNTPTGNEIKIKVQEEDGWISISVIDTGIGLEQEEIEKLFQKFGKLVRQDVVDDIEMQGTGLGLFISKQIIEAHGGTIWAESEGRGKGSTFTFKIPLVSDPNAGIA